MTAIRGDHPVDSHHYTNLDSYLNEFEPVRVPDPYDFDELLVGHVVTEVFAYLARNRHHSNVFDRMYTLNEVNQNLGAFVSDVEENLDILIEFLLDARRDELESHLKDIFGTRGIKAFEQAFVEEGPLSVDTRVEKTFSRITTMSGSAETNKAFTEQNNRLDQWLSELGYLANYRSFGQSFPVRFRDRSEEIQFESPGRLYDMYPGPENDLGSLITLHGSKYIVDDVHGSSTPLTTVMVCNNDECDRPFESYELDVATCPHCREELVETNVHGVSSVECKPARGGQKRYRTRGLMTTHVSTADTSQRESTTTQLFDLDCDVGYTSMEVTDFVYAFERGHSSSPTTDTLRSEALIERDSSTDDSHKSWEERLEDADTEEYAPVGQQYHTQGLTLTFDLDPIQVRLDTLEHESASWPQALISLEQALDQAIAVTAQCDRQDFRVDASKEADAVVVDIVDSRQGGNGITWQIHNAMTDVGETVKEIADCDRCEDYCDECLLLARTPAHYLENNLLHNQTLQAVLGGGDT
jgi:hypothetical protein